MSNNVLICQNLNKSYKQGENQLNILNNINLEVSYGETVSIVGSSGSGKSTFLHLLSGLDKANSGTIILDNEQISNQSDIKVCSIRNHKVGFIYQFHHLLPEFTATENILMPILINGSISKIKKDFALELLDNLGLANRATHYPSQLSGGERQRVAIARAVINNPKIVFADEPTGNLDNQTANQVLEIFFTLQRDLGTSLVVVTHDLDIAKKTMTSYRLHAGELSKI
jgi:lipoprotein-releasing system ATP-binding protein